MMITAPKGTKDILPAQTYKWQYVESVFRQVCASYGFKEIRTPVFEHTELFKRGVGDTTDVVEKQMYSFEDYAGRGITLKPEVTASVIRAHIENKLYADAQISKYCYIAPCFRYEKPQAGRLRQFHQFGVEVLGADSPVADAETIGVAIDLFERLGIGELELRINSVGCPACRKEYRAALQAFLKPSFEQLCDTCKGRFERNPMRILDCKSEICQGVSAKAPRMIDYMCGDCSKDFDGLKEALTAMEIDYVVDPNIVRGLDYYTRTAYEIVTNKIGAQGTVCGGGRYNGLMQELGGPNQTGVGFGLGIERLLLVMESFGFAFPHKEGVDVFAALMGPKAKALGLKLIHRLREEGLSVEMDLLERSFKNQFKYADRLHARFAMIIGDEEADRDIVLIKDMQSKTQKEVALAVVIEYLKEKVCE